jgi:hypothetical protein
MSIHRAIDCTALALQDRTRMHALVELLDADGTTTVARVHSALFPGRTRGAANRALHRLRTRVQASGSIRFDVTKAKRVGAELRMVTVKLVARRFTAAEMGIPAVDGFHDVPLYGMVLR